jgi:glutathione S-transferase
MRLLYSTTSPYVRKVLVALHETGLIDRVEMVPAPGSPVAPNPTTTALNPLGKIPCLERADGPALFDSRVICRYLDSLHGGRKLYPEGPALFSTLTLEALADGALDAGVLMLYESRIRPEDRRFPAWVDGQRLKLTRALDALESNWTAHLAGPLDAGAIAVACLLGWLDFRFGALEWRTDRPRLAAWHETTAQRPSLTATVPFDP